jgi:hypothetical protein
MSGSDITNTGSVYPISDNTYWSGIAGHGWYACYAYNFASASDRALKTDIEALPDCLGLVAAIKPQRYRWRKGPDTERTHWGFLAQDVEAAMSKASHDFGGHMVAEDQHTLAYPELVAVLWKAVQELTERVTDMEVAKQAAA